MTSARSAAFTQIPQTQNTAPVLEFRCLYTRDLVRKAKRWQDGYLKYHTFNRRVMVYDTQRNFIGDTFNPSDADLQEGDEMDLDKHFAMVQVAEPVGVTQTDLTELVESRHKRKDKAASPDRARGPQQKHRLLSDMLASPNGPLGRAILPTLSPYEDKQKRKAGEALAVSKRQEKRACREGPIRESEKTILGSKPRACGSPIISEKSILSKRDSGARSHIIELSSDGPEHTNLSSSPLVTSPIPPQGSSSRTPVMPQAGRRQAQAFQAQPKHVSVEDSQPRTDTSAQQRQPLKIISNAPRKMLLCQQRHKSMGLVESGGNFTSDRTDASTAARIGGQPEAAPLAPHQQRLKDRLARLGQKKHHISTVISSQDDDAEVGHPEPVPPTTNEPSRASCSKANAPSVDPRAATEDTAEAPAIRDTAPLTKPGTAKPTRKPGEPVIIGARQAAMSQGRAPKSVSEATGPRATTTAGAPDAAVDVPRTVGRLTLARSDSDQASKPFRPPARPFARALARTKVASGTTDGETKAVDPLDRGPWSREAFDLFDFWPPDRDKKGHKLATDTAVSA